jgi:hypothetical protein
MPIEEGELIKIRKTEKNNRLPIIMCTWKRTEGFLKVIDQLNQQNFQDFHLYVWNNNPEMSEQFQEIADVNCKFPCTMFHSKKNIGGFGRFYFARYILDKDMHHGHCIFIDDDQTFEKDSLEIFLNEAKPKQISSQWAWKIKTLDYYGKANRIEVKGGDEVDYCGTGGMVCDINIFSEDKLFECPEGYWFIEDLWLSFFANHYHGYALKKSSAKFKNGSDQHNLFDKIKHLKSPMLKDLVDNYGWKITFNK